MQTYPIIKGDDDDGDDGDKLPVVKKVDWQ